MDGPTLIVSAVMSITGAGAGLRLGITMAAGSLASFSVVQETRTSTVVPVSPEMFREPSSFIQVSPPSVLKESPSAGLAETISISVSRANSGFPARTGMVAVTGLLQGVSPSAGVRNITCFPAISPIFIGITQGNQVSPPSSLYSRTEPSWSETICSLVISRLRTGTGVTVGMVSSVTELAGIVS